MKLRQLSIIAGIGIFAVAIILTRILSAGPDTEEHYNESIIPAIGVPVIIAEPGEEVAEINFTGRVIPEQNVELYAEVSGNLKTGNRLFKAGTAYKQGEVLIGIDEREQMQTVLNLKSSFQSLLTQVLADMKIDYPDEFEIWNKYLEEMVLEEDLEPLPSSDDRKFNLFLAARSVPANFYSIKQSEVRLSKYQILAPFDGVVTESLLDPGTLVRANQKLGEFTKTDYYEIEASVNVNNQEFITIGDRVQMEVDGSRSGPIEAEIVRINPIIDETTQTIIVYFRVRNNGLFTGQYVSGTISGERFDNAERVATKSLVRNNLLFLIENDVATIREVEVLATSRDSSIVRGLEPGDVVIDEFRDASFEGIKVTAIN